MLNKKKPLFSLSSNLNWAFNWAWISKNASLFCFTLKHQTRILSCPPLANQISFPYTENQKIFTSFSIKKLKQSSISTRLNTSKYFPKQLIHISLYYGTFFRFHFFFHRGRYFIQFFENWGSYYLLSQKKNDEYILSWIKNAQFTSWKITKTHLGYQCLKPSRYVLVELQLFAVAKTEMIVKHRRYILVAINLK